MSVDLTNLKANVGVYTDPEHNLYVAPAEPTAEAVTSGEELKEGEVIVEMKSTGICGYVSSCSLCISDCFSSLFSVTSSWFSFFWTSSGVPCYFQ